MVVSFVVVALVNHAAEIILGLEAMNVVNLEVGDMVEIVKWSATGSVTVVAMVVGTTLSKMVVAVGVVRWIWIWMG